MNDSATINRIYAWADKKRIKYNNEYQMSGSPSAMKTFERYDDICDICLLAERGGAEEDLMRKHIHKNQMAHIDRLRDLRNVSPGKTFSYAEVEDWMRGMMV